MVTDFEIIFIGLYFAITMGIVYWKRNIMFYNIIEDPDPDQKIKEKTHVNHYIIFLTDTYAYNPLASP